MQRSENGRALFYTRDSGGKHEMTPGEYIKWACRQAKEFELTFRGTVAEIQRMIQRNLSSSGDLFLDYGVSGNYLVRNGLDALFHEVDFDKTVSHVLIPQRDRVARPDDLLEALNIENSLRKKGVTLVFMDRVCPPVKSGERADIAELIVAAFEYDQAGKFRRDLAQKMLYAQLSLANAGYSTGGRAPFGFRRWLVTAEGTRVRQLEDSEIVRKAGHHVVWLPGPESELKLIMRIREMLKTTPASRVAKILTSEGIPSPNAGKLRTDNAVKHRVSGNWNQATIVKIARNPLLIAVVEYGTRSMGDQLRFSKDGPRLLEDEDYRYDHRQKKKPKVIRNPDARRIRASAQFEPLVELEDHQNLQSILDKRAGTQRGKPRSRNPSENPLGCRVFDMNCTWPMYRVRYQKSFRYTCGQYQQSSSRQCDHNHVDGIPATNFALRTIQRFLGSPELLEKLRQRFLSFARQEQSKPQNPEDLCAKQAELVQLERDLEKVGRNLAMAETEGQHQVVAKVFAELESKKAILESEVRILQSISHSSRDIDGEIEAAMSFAAQLSKLTTMPEGLKSATEAIRMADFKLYLKFEKVRAGKRDLNKVSGGVATIGAVSPPIQVYSGRTDREYLKLNGTAVDSAVPLLHELRTSAFSSGQEGNSSGNVNRADRI